MITPSRPRPATVAVATCAYAVGLMAWDHLWGNERRSGESFPVDAPTFGLAVALIAATAGIVYGVTVPRSLDRPAGVSRAALAHSAAAVLLVLPAGWLGFPVVVAGGGLTLSLARSGAHGRRVSVAAGILAVLVILLALLATAVPPADSD